MQHFSPEVIATMRVVLDDVISHVLSSRSLRGIKARLAESILKTAQEGHTSYDALYAAAFDQIQTVLAMLT